MVVHALSKVVKTEMTSPLCVEHHVDIHLDTFITSIKMDVRKYVFTFKLPPLKLVTKNGF
jgi:hypothetical protein